MKKVIFFLILLTIFACTKVKKDYFPNGNIKSEITYKNGKKNGPAKYYDDLGKISDEYIYVNDKLEGISKKWFYKGTISRIDSFKNNMLNGISVSFDQDNGYKLKEETYKNDTLNGLFCDFHPNGQIMTKGYFLKGLYDSVWNYYDNRGIPVGQGIYKNGTGILKGWFLNGKPIREVHYVGNKKNGTETRWNEKGEITRIIIYKDDRIVSQEILIPEEQTSEENDNK